MQADEINLCQPGSGKGCSVCCGLFNFMDISEGNLGRYLNDGAVRDVLCPDYIACSVSAYVRDVTTHICPYQGFVSDGIPGCLVHPSCGTDGRDRSLFTGSICSGFFCPAHSVLSDAEKIFIINNAENWYLYSIAVIDPESFSYIYEYTGLNYPDVHGSKKEAFLVNRGLEAHAENLYGYTESLFFYSVSEYNLAKRGFCIKYNSDYMKRVLSRIRECASGSPF